MTLSNKKICLNILYNFVRTEKEITFRNNPKIPTAEAEDLSVDISQEMPRALVMLRLILTMVGRKLSRNPNTYSSVLGLLWSLISFK